jgi:RNA polymerase sigma-70 factor (ECF subfamily)
MSTSISKETVSAPKPEAEPTASGIQEELWVLQAQQGNEEALQALVNRFDRRLLYYLMRFTNSTDEALDVAQDVWVRVCRGLIKLRSPRGFRAWLFRIAHDSIVSHIRRQAREGEILEEFSCEPSFGAVQPEPVTEDLEQVHHALGALSPAHREILVLRFFEAMSLEEIAHALCRSLGTVKSRLHYAKQALKKQLEDHHEQEQ